MGNKSCPGRSIHQNKLCEAEVMLSQRATVTMVSKKIGVSDYSYYRWHKEYGGMRVDQAHWLKELKQENSRLKGW